MPQNTTSVPSFKLVTLQNYPQEVAFVIKDRFGRFPQPTLSLHLFYSVHNKLHKYDNKIFTSEITCHLYLSLLLCQRSGFFVLTDTHDQVFSNSWWRFLDVLQHTSVLLRELTKTK